jgi:hypothetical protein
MVKPAIAIRSRGGHAPSPGTSCANPAASFAGAIQYGHLHAPMTLGYGGAYDSGFPDEHAFEQWLLRLDQLADG